MPVRLSVNVNKVALLRNSRGGGMPDVQLFAADCIRFGAQGITVHPRPDERHIRQWDVPLLQTLCQQAGVEFNVEGYPSGSFLQLMQAVRPSQVTLVPDPPDALTSSEGWQAERADFLRPIVAQLHSWGCRVSLFCDTQVPNVEALATTCTDRIELYTGPYAAAHALGPQQALRPYVHAAKRAQALGLGLNAGHDLNQTNLPDLVRHLPHLLEVSIGHALICDALYDGLEATIASYLQKLS